ncbi:MAG TPA: hypothetical protein DD490_07500 [Acidobacteria bacterium]|nr:hypothetical protein [Acidobacteriota bacterium]
MEFRSLELTISATGSPAAYRIAAASDRQGHTEELRAFAPSAPPVETLAALLARPVLLSELKASGSALFELLFSGKVGGLFRSALGEALAQEDRGLRIVLRIEPPELTVLPWEMLYDSHRGLFLATSPKSPVSRTLSLLEPIRSIACPQELQALVIAPPGLGLITDPEVARLEEHLRRVATVERLTGLVTRESVRRALRERQYHLIHYAGHGGFRNGEAVIYLNDPGEGQSDPVPAGVFAQIFLDHPSVRLVVLNSCEGAARSATEIFAGTAAQLLQRGVPAVIAMQTAIKNSEAMIFAETFYSELVRGPQNGNVEVALARARGALMQDKSFEDSLVIPTFASPVLYVRAPDGQLWRSSVSRTDSVAQKLAEGTVGSLPAQEALFRRAVARFLLEDFRAAREQMDALVKQGGDPQYLLNLGYLLYLEGKYSEALETFDEFIERHPYTVEAFLNAFKTSLAMNDCARARVYCDAAVKLAPERTDVKKARAQYLLETGDVRGFLQAIGEVPDAAIFSRPADADLERVRQNASILVGEERVSVMIAVFAGSGLRTILVGYRDPASTLPRPADSYRWIPLRASAGEKLSVEKIEAGEGEVGMVGYRVNGLEEGAGNEPQGFLIADFRFSGLRGLPRDLYCGLLLVDCDRQLRLEPRKIHVRELLEEAKGDLVDLYQDLLRPAGRFTSEAGGRPRVFLSYATEDAEAAEWIARGLMQRGIDVWKDKESLRIGDKFEDRIDDAITRSDFAIVCLSTRSIAKSGYVQREIRRILDVARLRPLHDTFVLPVKLDECDVPRQFRDAHWLEIGLDRQVFLDRLAADIFSLHGGRASAGR